jgi:hypothetical protein
MSLRGFAMGDSWTFLQKTTLEKPKSCGCGTKKLRETAGNGGFCFQRQSHHTFGVQHLDERGDCSAYCADEDLFS